MPGIYLQDTDRSKSELLLSMLDTRSQQILLHDALNLSTGYGQVKVRVVIEHALTLARSNLRERLYLDTIANVAF
ncbi:unnamed protein product [Haemonchus placei]|uniref:IstB_IS21 domain-containing protein n=1 Tax=Haemonchus placei TaxID=6290 RepID=A0A0N4VZ86_HAEPC|nr:unnamed protein product [Haemonchus placei]